MGQIGPGGFYLFTGVLFVAMAFYAAYRMTQRPAIPVDETIGYTPMSPTSSPVAQEWAIETAIEEAIEEAESDNAT